MLVFLYLPLAVLIAYSFNRSRLNILWEGFTLEWYAAVWRDAALVRSLENSLIVALMTTLASVALGTAGAWLLHRHRFRGARLLQTLLLAPMVVPEVILGISLLLLFVALRFELGFATVVISHVTFCVPFVMVAVQARLADLDPALEEAALDLGATPARAFARVVVPQLAPALVAGALMAFTLSLDELIVTWFTASASSRTLPLEIFGRVRKGLDPTLNAISTVFVVASIALVAVSELARRSRPGRRGAVVVLLAALLTASGCTRSNAPQELNLFAWSEYVPQRVLDAFTDETGIKVNYESYASNEEMLAKLVSGATQYDLVQPSDYAAEALIAEGRLQPLDWSKIPNFENIAPEYRNRPFDPEQKYTVPWMAGTVGIVINSERVPEDVDSYAEVFQDKHKGRIVVVDDPREMVSWALATQGIPINDINPTTLAKVKPVLARWLPLVKVFDSDSPKTALLNGDVDLGIVWSGEAALLYNEHPKFRYVLPEEGAHEFVDTLAIPANARNPDAAHAFLNYVLRPEVSREISLDFPYTNPNLAARKLLTPEELANPASYPPGNPKLDGFRDIGEQAVAVDRLVTDLKAAGS